MLDQSMGITAIKGLQTNLKGASSGGFWGKPKFTAQAQDAFTRRVRFGADSRSNASPAAASQASQSKGFVLTDEKRVAISQLNELLAQTETETETKQTREQLVRLLLQIAERIQQGRIVSTTAKNALKNTLKRLDARLSSVQEKPESQSTPQECEQLRSVINVLSEVNGRLKTLRLAASSQKKQVSTAELNRQAVKRAVRQEADAAMADTAWQKTLEKASKRTGVGPSEGTLHLNPKGASAFTNSTLIQRPAITVKLTGPYAASQRKAHDMNRKAFELLREALPQSVQAALAKMSPEWCSRINEVVLERGRFPKVILAGKIEPLPLKAETPVTEADLQEVQTNDKITPRDSADRSSIKGTNHRVSWFNDNEGNVHRVRFRVSRFIPGVADNILPTIEVFARAHQKPPSLLIAAPPEAGKTTLLRDLMRSLSVSRIVSDSKGNKEKSEGLRVAYIDPNTEIGGPEGTMTVDKEFMTGNAEQYFVQKGHKSKDTMARVTRGGSVGVMVYDEIPTPEDIDAISNASKNGISLICSAHASSILEMTQKQDFHAMLGGIEQVTMGDDHAKSKQTADGTGILQKLVVQAGTPLHDMAVVLKSKTEAVIYPNLKQAIDYALAQQQEPPYAAIGESTVGKLGYAVSLDPEK
jgi:stage III sporulation protein SpoIIIAA